MKRPSLRWTPSSLSLAIDSTHIALVSYTVAFTVAGAPFILFAVNRGRALHLYLHRYAFSSAVSWLDNNDAAVGDMQAEGHRDDEDAYRCTLPKYVIPFVVSSVCMLNLAG